MKNYNIGDVLFGVGIFIAMIMPAIYALVFHVTGR